MESTTETQAKLPAPLPEEHMVDAEPTAKAIRDTVEANTMWGEEIDPRYATL